MYLLNNIWNYFSSAVWGILGITATVIVAVISCIVAWIFYYLGKRSGDKKHNDLIERYDKLVAIYAEIAKKTSPQDATPEQEVEIRTFAEIITNPKTAGEFFLKAYVAQIDEHHDTAIKYYKKSLDLDPDDAHVYNNMGVAYKNKGDHDKAIEYCQKAIELKPDNAEPYNNMGIAYGGKGDHDKATECFLKAIKLKPDYAEAYNNMGNAYDNKGDHDKAIECYLKAIELKPDYANAYCNMGIAYGQGKRDYDKAIEYCQKAIDLKPDFAMAYYNMGMAYGLNGNEKKAIECIKTAAQLGNEEAQKFLSKNNS